MEIIYSSIYHIDFEEEEIKYIEINGDDIIEYIENIIKEMTENKSVKKFNVKRDTTEIISISNQFVSGANTVNDDGTIALTSDFEEECSEKIATKLLKSEKLAQQRIDRMNKKVKKGSLIQLFVEDNDVYKFILVKVEHEGYLNTETLKRQAGLPLNKKILKSCIIEYNEENEIKDIFLYDSSSSISDYWYNLFLELEAIRDDTKNTGDTITKVNKIIKRELAEHPKEEFETKNRLKGYFLTKDEFYLDEFVQIVSEPIKQMNNNIDVEEIEEKVKNRISKYCDGQFSIDKEIINKNKPDTFFITEQISLIVNGECGSRIVSEMEDGKRILKVIGVPQKVYDVFVRTE